MDRGYEKWELPTGSVPSKFRATSSFEFDSELSFFEKDTTSEKGFFWKSRYQHAMYFFAYTFSWGMISSHRKGKGIEDKDSVPNWFHMLLSYAFFAGPLLYLQVFIGQYTQKGCTVLGAMLPLAYGIGFCMLLNTLFSCSLNVYFCSAVLYYTLISMVNYPTPPWMICLPGYRTSKERCFSRDDIDLCTNCRNPNHEMIPSCYTPGKDAFAAEFFQESIVFGSEMVEGTIVSPKLIQMLNLFFTIVFVLILTVRSIKDLDGSIHFASVFTSVAIVLTLAAILLSNPRLQFIVEMFYFNFKSMFDINCWAQAFASTALKLNIVESGHLLFGSYMPLTVNCTGRIVYLLSFHILFNFVGNMLAFLMEDYLDCSLNLNENIWNRYSDLQTTFSLYPTALGILAAAQLWATMYFLMLFSMTLHTIALQIIIVQETLSQDIIDSTYWVYTRVLLVILVGTIAVLYSTFGGSTFAYELFLHRNAINFTIISIIYIILVVYGFDRIGDDIHFILHSPPSKYLKWSWGLSSVICCFLLGTYFLQESYLQSPEVTGIVATIIFLPLPIGFLVQLFKAVKVRELSALVKPSRTFGPVDIEERASRKLFNPRFEVRFRRKRNLCNHRCLLGSVPLRKCLEKELTLLSHIVVELSEKEEEILTKKEFLEALKKHKELMTNALNFDPTKEYFRYRGNETKYT